MVSGARLALRGEASQAIALMGVELERTSASSICAEPRGRALGAGAGRGHDWCGTGIRLGRAPGDRFTIDTGSVTEPVRVVTALLDMGVKDLNRRTVVIPLRSAQNLLRRTRRGHGAGSEGGGCLANGRNAGPATAQAL